MLAYILCVCCIFFVCVCEDNETKPNKPSTYYNQNGHWSETILEDDCFDCMALFLEQDFKKEKSHKKVQRRRRKRKTCHRAAPHIYFHTFKHNIYGLHLVWWGRCVFMSFSLCVWFRWNTQWSKWTCSAEHITLTHKHKRKSLFMHGQWNELWLTKQMKNSYTEKYSNRKLKEIASKENYSNEKEKKRIEKLVKRELLFRSFPTCCCQQQK